MFGCCCAPCSFASLLSFPIDILTASTVDEHMPKDKEYTVPMEQANDYTKETTMFGSPFQICLDRHEENKRKFTKSPGDGFHMASRPMFQSEFAEQSQVVVFIVLFIISNLGRRKEIRPR